MIVEIQTQVRENYGTHDWDGNGDVPQYWKNKGGDEYYITDVPEGADVESLVDRALRHLDLPRSDDYFQEYVVGTETHPDTHVPWREQEDISYYGRIIHPARRITFNELSR